MQDAPMPKLRQLAYSPDVNPLATPKAIGTKTKYVRTGHGRELIDATTGELGQYVSLVHTVQQKDDAQFVKIFSDGIKAAFELTKTAARVFNVVLEQYEKEPMTRGYVDSIYLAWFDGGLSGQNVGLSEATFNRGMRELVQKGFIYPRSPSLYWVNPNLFFKGDRVIFIKEYVKAHNDAKRIAHKEASTRTIDNKETP